MLERANVRLWVHTGHATPPQSSIQEPPLLFTTHGRVKSTVWVSFVPFWAIMPLEEL